MVPELKVGLLLLCFNSLDRVLPRDPRHRCCAFSPFQRRQRLTKVHFRLIPSMPGATASSMLLAAPLCCSSFV